MDDNEELLLKKMAEVTKAINALADTMKMVSDSSLNWHCLTMMHAGISPKKLANDLINNIDQIIEYKKKFDAEIVKLIHKRAGESGVNLIIHANPNPKNR